MESVARTQKVGLVLAQLGAVLIALGGLGDQAVQKLMPSHEVFLGVAPGAAPHAVEQLFLAVLHALGTSLMAVGLGAFVLVRVMARLGQPWLGAVVATMVLLSAGVLTIIGVALYALATPEKNVRTS